MLTVSNFNICDEYTEDTVEMSKEYQMKLP